MKTIDIHGKPYVMVKDRVIHFNKEYPNGCIRNKLIERIDNIVVFESMVIPDIANPERYFTGHAEEEIGSSQINHTSALENCETSACGRALAMMGIGSDESLASGDEVANAIFQQKQEDATGITQAHAEKVVMDSIATGETTAVEPSSPNPSVTGLVCHLCKKDMVDKRVWEDGEWKRQTTQKGKVRPAFTCIDNDDFINPTCKGVIWDAPVDDVKEQDQEMPLQPAEDIPF